jgi:hypothetical protein
MSKDSSSSSVAETSIPKAIPSSPRSMMEQITNIERSLKTLKIQDIENKRKNASPMRGNTIGFENVNGIFTGSFKGASGEISAIKIDINILGVFSIVAGYVEISIGNGDETFSRSTYKGLISREIRIYSEKTPTVLIGSAPVIYQIFWDADSPGVLQGIAYERDGVKPYKIYGVFSGEKKK